MRSCMPVSNVSVEFRGRPYPTLSIVDLKESTPTTGYFNTEMVVAGITYSSAPYNDDNAYIVKYDSSGSIQWITTVKGPYTAGGGMTVDPITNNPVAAGYACNSITVGDLTASTGGGSCGIYVTELRGTPIVAPPLQVVASQRVALTERALPASYYDGVPGAADDPESCFAGG